MVGAVSTPVVFKVSVVVLLAALVEWMVQGWAERASADGQGNAAVRRRLLQPLEFPILAPSASVRSCTGGHAAHRQGRREGDFGILGAIILGGGFLFATKRQTSRSTILGISAVALLASMGAGVAPAISGQRTIEAHPTTVSDAAVCLEPGIAGEVDDHAAQDVSAKSSVVANIFVKQDGKLVVLVNGYPNTEYHELTVPRGVNVRAVPQRVRREAPPDGSPGHLLVAQRPSPARRQEQGQGSLPGLQDPAVERRQHDAARARRARPGRPADLGHRSLTDGGPRPHPQHARSHTRHTAGVARVFVRDAGIQISQGSAGAVNWQEPKVLV